MGVACLWGVGGVVLCCYGYVACVLVLELLMALPLEHLSIEHIDENNNTALHLSCVQVHTHHSYMYSSTLKSVKI